MTASMQARRITGRWGEIRSNVSGLVKWVACAVGAVLVLGQTSTALAQAERLPQDHPYQRTIYSWMGTLKLSDVTIPSAIPKWDGTYRSTTELANMWKEMSIRAVTNPVTPGGVIRAQPRWFVLNDGAGGGVEGSGVVRNARYPNNAAYWYQRSLPLANGGEGNPFYKNKGLCNRVLVTTAIDLMLSDHWQERGSNPWGTSVWAESDPRFLGGLMNSWAYSYGVCKEVLPKDVQQAFEDGLERMALKLNAETPNRNTPNMQTRVVSAMAILYKATDDPSLRDLALRTARKFMFGYEDGVLETKHKFPQSLFYPAGYVQEGYSPETTYNGVSLYHLVEARAHTWGDKNWDFMDEPIRRMSDFRSHQLFPDPNGFVDGPSAYAGRTGASWNKLQADMPWRDITVAAAYKEGRMFGTAIPGIDGMISKIKSTLTGDRIVSAFKETNTNGVGPFAIDHDHHWPSYTPYTAPDGWYDGLRALTVAKDPSLVLPYERKGYYFNRSFANDFWSYKDTDGERDFGFFVETEADGGTYAGYRGGSLQAFWIKDAGTVILGRQNKASDGRVWAELDTWGTNHVWGKSSAGRFSTAVEAKRSVSYSLNGTVPTVKVSGDLTGDTQEVPHSINVETEFAALANGIRITHTLSPKSSTQISELWATLPVYLRNCEAPTNRGFQCKVPDTQIEYWSGKAWQPLGTTPVVAERLRLGRDWGSGLKYAYVVLGKARPVKLSASVWEQEYQDRSRLRNVHISLIDNPGSSRPMPASVSVTYSLTTSTDVVVPDNKVARQSIELNAGWNLVSTYVEPEEASLPEVLADVADKISVVVDNSGRTYVPSLGINEIGNWTVGEAYKIYCAEDISISIQGDAVDDPVSINLPAGWSLLAFPESLPRRVEEVLASIADDIVVVKDENGKLYSPAQGVNEIGNLQPGAAYQVFLKDKVILVFPPL